MIYLFTAAGFPPGGSDRETCTKIGNRQQKRRNNTQKIQKQYKQQRIHKTENKKKLKTKTSIIIFVTKTRRNGIAQKIK